MTPDHNAAGHSAANLSVTGHGHGASGKFIEAVDLSLSFGSTPALRGASLGVAKGEIVAVMGPSGSGKSTLLHCLAGILVPSSGEVHFNGVRLDRLSDDKRSALRRDRFGFVFQSGQLVPELTAEENVALPLLLSGMRRGPAMAGRRSASRLPAAWSPSPKCSSPTSRPGRWTRCPASW
jgi:putative ABC transport system ATP-binding protein